MTQPVALITGGSRGIGRATALLLAQQGYRVAINYRSNGEAADKLVAEIQENHGQALALQADIGVESEVKAMFKRLDETWGRLDALVNNAGILEQQLPLVDLDLARWHRVFNTNVFGAFLVTQQAIVRMATSKGGSGGAIVNVSSGAAKTGSPFEYVDYAASKGALDSMTIGLAKELAEESIRVNGVRPGFIYTDMHADGGEPERVNRMVSTQQIPLGRGGQPEDVAEAIAWLLSDKASFCTGTFIDTTGGR